VFLACVCDLPIPLARVFSPPFIVVAGTLGQLALWRLRT
jgi:hypothetical protein